MTDTLTQSDLQPPAQPPRVATGIDDWPDDIRALGDRIAELTLEQAVELTAYLEEQ